MTTNGAASLAQVPILRFLIGHTPSRVPTAGPQALGFSTDWECAGCRSVRLSLSPSLCPSLPPQYTSRTRIRQDTQDAGQGTHIHTHTHTHTHTPCVNKPSTPGLRAPVQGLFSPSHVRAHTAPGPAWADADARQPVMPLPAGLRCLQAGAPGRGPSPPYPAKLASAPTCSPDFCPSPPPTLRAAGTLERRLSRPRRPAPGTGARRPCCLRAPRAGSSPRPAILTLLSICFSWCRWNARVPLPSGPPSSPRPGPSPLRSLIALSLAPESDEVSFVVGPAAQEAAAKL